MTSSIDIDRILQSIKATIEERRAAGEYPPGLEQQLEQEFSQIISMTNRRYFSHVELENQISALKAQLELLSGQTTVQSRIIGLSHIHRILKFLTKRQILGLTDQIRRVEDQTITVLSSLASFAKAQEDADRRLVKELSQHVLDRIAVVDHLAIITTEIEERLARIESRIKN